MTAGMIHKDGPIPAVVNFKKKRVVIYVIFQPKTNTNRGLVLLVYI